MHDHSGGGATGHAFVNLLPLWLQVAWVVALAGVTAWAVLSLVFVRGSLRVAAGLHALCGVGMLDMFAPWAGSADRSTFWLVTFAVASAVSVAGLANAYRSRSTAAVWALVAVDSLAMTYMFALFRVEISLLTYALVGVFVLFALGWVYGVFDSAHGPMCRQLPRVAPSVTPATAARGVQATMALSMAYMFLLMDSGTGEFFAKAFTLGVTEQTYWAVALLGLGARVAFDPRLVRQLMGGFRRGQAWGLR